MGLPTAIIYLITLFLFMPFPFTNWFEGINVVHEDVPHLGTFPYNKVRTYGGGLYGICLLKAKIPAR